MIIGITGGTGCGKTTLLSLLQGQGFTVLDCDEIYHDLLKTDKNLLAALDARFPGTVRDGVLDRKKLGTIVFADGDALKDLNRITHAAVKKQVLRLLPPSTQNAAIDAIGLFESGMDELCKLTIAVTSPVEMRVRRLMARDNISEKYARARIAAQPAGEVFQARCDYTLVNDGTEKDFQEKCLAFLSEQGIINV